MLDESKMLDPVNICGERIRKFRTQRKYPMSLQQFANAVNEKGLFMDKYMIYRIEAGKRSVRDTELKAFAQVLHVSYSDLID